MALLSVSVVVDAEGDQGAGAVDDLDVLDGADLHAGDADVVALDHAGGVDEDGAVVVLRARTRCCRSARPGPTSPASVTTMKTSSLTRSEVVRRSRSFIAATPPLRGPSGRPAARRGRARRRRSRRGPGRAASAAARSPRGCPGRWCGSCALGATRLGALAGRLVDAVVEVRLVAHRVGLVPRRVRQVQAAGPAVLAEARGVARRRTPRGWWGSVSSTMCRVKPRNASAWSLPALTMPRVRQVYSGAYFAKTRSCCRADLAEPDQVVAVVVEEVGGGVGEGGDVVEEGVQLLLATLEGAGGEHGVVEDLGDLRQHVGVVVGDLRGRAGGPRSAAGSAG